MNTDIITKDCNPPTPHQRYDAWRDRLREQQKQREREHSRLLFTAHEEYFGSVCRVIEREEPIATRKPNNISQFLRRTK